MVDGVSEDPPSPSCSSFSTVPSTVPVVVPFSVSVAVSPAGFLALAVIVIVASPSVTAVTLPSVSTDATLSSLDSYEKS